MGIVGILCPDDYPLLGFVSLLAPAVVRSNCVIIVPSEKYPVSALDLYQARKPPKNVTLVNMSMMIRIILCNLTNITIVGYILL